jgi:FAD/FMN-containing dehydrogenase
MFHTIGHIGDGNLHLNILRPDNLSPEVFRRLCEDVNDKLVALLNRFSGSISAEHGVGLLKKKYLSASRTLDEIEYMKMIKNCFDPNGILNPGKIFEM